MKILICELYKALVKQKAIFFILIFALIKLVFLFSSSGYSVEITEQNKILYKEYLMHVNGMLTDDKEDFIESEKLKIDRAASEKDNINNNYINGKISEEDYILKIQNIDSSLKKSDAFKILYDQYLFVKQNPTERYFLYINGWNNFLSNENLDIILVILLLIVITPIFTKEYEKDMIPLIITSKKGKILVPVSKLIAAGVITVFAALSFLILEYLFFKIKYGLPFGSYPIQSIPFFKTSQYDLSLEKAYLLICVIKITGFLVFTCAISFVSVALKKTVISLFLCISSVLIPYFIFFNDSAKYELPLPLGFMIGNGYLRGTNVKDISKNVIGFSEVSRQSFMLEIVYLFILSTLFVITLILAFSKLSRKVGKKIENI